VRLRTGTLVAEVAEGGVALAGGGHLEADLVLVGIGVRPATGWLAGCGLDLERGVLTDPAGRTNLPGVVAVGDCAARWSPRAGRYLRGEHWDDALHAPAAAVAALLGQPDEATDAVPYVWSEQFGRYLQWTGWRDDAEPAVWRGDPAGRDWAAAWLSAEGVLTGFLAVDRHRDSSQARRLIAAGHAPDPVKLADPGIPLRAT
jgi:3-phenylpropionate/trans-cinnamate dioxygenase ferredoxin reductase component